MLYQIVSNIADKVELFIEDDMTVGEVRVLIGQMINADEETIRLTFQGHVLEDNKMTWGLVLDMYPLAEESARKIFVYVSEKLRANSVNFESVRASLLSATIQEEEKAAREEAKFMEPIIDYMVKDPSMIEMMVSSVPELKKVLDDEPELRSQICNPETLKNLMMSQIDPDMRRTMSREMGLQLAQISAHPGGEQMLEHYTSKYLSDMAALSEMNATPPRERVDEAQAQLDQKKGINREALPNPWEQQTTPAPPHVAPRPLADNQAISSPLAALFGANAAGAGNVPPTTPFYGSANPFAAALLNRQPVMPPANTWNAAQPQSASGGGAKNGGVAAARWVAELVVLKEMGFENEELCLEALTAANGDIDEAVNYIVSKNK